MTQAPTPPWAPTGVAASVGVRHLAALLLCAGCAPPETAPPSAWAERDSAGMVVVENRLDLIPEGTWTVDPTPLLSVGGLDPRESHQLFRVAGATRLPDGRVAVASGGSCDVRIYGTDGSLLARWGRQGDGPDEFRNPALMGRHGADTLVVFDATLSRITLVHPETGIVASAAVAWSGKGFPVGRGLGYGGALLVGGGMTFSSEEGFPSGPLRPLSTFGWIARDGSAGPVLGDFPAAEMFARANDQGFMARGLPFGRVTVAAPAAPQGAWVGQGEAWRLVLHDSLGTPTRVALGDAAPRPVTAGDRTRYVEEALRGAGSENEARQLRALMDEMPFPEVFPPYRALVVDAAGNLWVGDHPDPGEEVTAWTVLDALGRGVARVSTPPGTRILEIGEDYVLGRTADEMDVESLTLWRLRRE